jgi:hypothetical protein
VRTISWSPRSWRARATAERSVADSTKSSAFFGPSLRRSNLSYEASDYVVSEGNQKQWTLQKELAGKKEPTLEGRVLGNLGFEMRYALSAQPRGEWSVCGAYCRTDSSPN